MAIKAYNPTTPGRRGMTSRDFSEVTSKNSPVRSLVSIKKVTAGRNNQGRITTRHKGSGVKRFIRNVNFNLASGTKAVVEAIEYDPGRSANIARIKDQASEYLLGENAHPHVTLCQFQANEEQLESIWSAVEKLDFKAAIEGTQELDFGLDSNLKALKLCFHHFYIKPGFHFHKDKYWLGLAMSASPELLALQKALHTLLAQMDIESPTLPQSYFPHLTLARCHTADYTNPPQIRVLPALDMWQQDFVFQVSLGRSNEYGVYLERLKIL